MKKQIMLIAAILLSITIISKTTEQQPKAVVWDSAGTETASQSRGSFPSHNKNDNRVVQSNQSIVTGLKALPLVWPISNAPEAADSFDSSTSITVLLNNDTIALSLRDYLIGVVAAEMPASFEPEALKAQAVASRSCTLYNAAHNSVHTQADICAQSNCCQAFATQEVMHSKWGENYEKYYGIIAQAVDATDGICLFYDKELIYAPYHSSSYAATESSGRIWSEKPYLVSVSSPESPDDVPNFTVTCTISQDEFISCLSEAYPNCSIDNDLCIGDISLSESGRVDSITVNNVSIPGSKLRSLFSLRSTNVDIQQNGDSITFTTYGWGHGVGMSQYGADAMAESGASYEEILKWYYTGVELDIPT